MFLQSFHFFSKNFTQLLSKHKMSFSHLWLQYFTDQIWLTHFRLLQMCQPVILSLFLNKTLTRTSRQRSSVPFCQSAPQKVSSHPVCCKPKASGQHSVYISYFHNGAPNNKVDWSWETSITFYKNKQNTFKIKIWYEIYLLILSKLPGFDLVCIIVGKEHNLEYILHIARLCV